MNPLEPAKQNFFLSALMPGRMAAEVRLNHNLDQIRRFGPAKKSRSFKQSRPGRRSAQLPTFESSPGPRLGNERISEAFFAYLIYDQSNAGAGEVRVFAESSALSRARGAHLFTASCRFLRLSLPCCPISLTPALHQTKHKNRVTFVRFSRVSLAMGA